MTRTNGPFWKAAFVLWVAALCGVFLVLPYVTTLENKALAAAALRTHLKVRELIAISVVQTAVLLAIAVILGQWAARKLGLGTPLIEALLAGRSVSERSLSTLLVALALGIATAVALMMLDHWIFAPTPAVAELIDNAESGSARPSASINKPGPYAILVRWHPGYMRRTPTSPTGCALSSPAPGG